MLEVWGGGRLLRDLSVPAPLHGAVYNDGWFAAGAALVARRAADRLRCRGARSRAARPW